MKMEGKRALVTGAGTGIGREIALEFARQGADVVLHYSHSDTGAVSAVKEIRAMGRRASAFPANFNSMEEIHGLAGQAIEFLGRVDCLVNNAGITFNKPFLKTTPEQFDALIAVNLRAPYFLTQRIVESMLQNGGGTVCNLGSIHAFAGASEHSIYAATKGAVASLTRTLAMELAHRGVRVNAIAPGWVNVENYFNAWPGFSRETAAREAHRTVPVARAGEPLDIAKLAVFLCSEDSGFIVGQTIVADGGSSSLLSLMPDFRAESKTSFGKGYVPGA